jgi:1-deoxy-D-xylulose-5-phosphate reductoisomerase
LTAGGTAPAILNAANEIAVQAFLDRRVGFRMIDQIVARVMDQVPYTTVTDIGALMEQDRVAREAAYSLV